MKEIKTESKEEIKEVVLIQYIAHQLNATQCSKLLCMSKRQFFRLVKAFREKGLEGLFRKKRVFGQKISACVKQKISELYKNDYYDFDFIHFNEILKTKFDINVSYSYLRETLNGDEITSPLCQHKTLRKIKRRIKATKTQNNMGCQNPSTNNSSIILDEEPRNRIARVRKSGRIVEMDGCSMCFFGEKKQTLHLAIDSCTRKILGGYFDNQETLNGYYNITKQMLENYGKPKIILTDNRSCFNSTSSKKDNQITNSHIQFAYAMNELNINLKTSSVSTAKPHIERVNGSVQRRLPQELRINNINTIEDANRYLIEQFIPRYNEKFGLNDAQDNLFEKLQPDTDLNKVLSILTTRKFDKAGTISFKNNYYMPVIEQDSDKYHVIRNIAKGTKCLVVTSFDKKLYICVNGAYYTAINLESIPVDLQYKEDRNAYILDKSNIASPSSIKNNTKKYTPWRYDMFTLFIKNNYNITTNE